MLQVKEATGLTVSSQPPGLNNGCPQRAREPEKSQAACLLRGLGGAERNCSIRLEDNRNQRREEEDENAMQIQQPAFVSSNH